MTIKFPNRTIKLNKLMRLSLENIRKISCRKKCREFVLLKHGKKGFEKATIAVINFLFDDLQNIDKSDPAWKDFSPQYVRECLIKEMFRNGYSIEQIVYETNLSLQKLSLYLPLNEIYEQGKRRLNKHMPPPKHPYEDVVNRFYDQISR